MTILFLVLALIMVGLLIGLIAGWIWKDSRPIGVPGDYIVSVISTVVIGLLDWYVIPAMNFSNSLRNLGVIFEPPLGALLVLWVIKKAKQ